MTTLGQASLRVGEQRWLPALSQPQTLQNLGTGNPCKLPSEAGKVLGREWIAATVREDGFHPTAPARRILREEGFRETRHFSEADFREKIWPLLAAKTSPGQLLPPVLRKDLVVAQISFAAEPVSGFPDRHGAFLIDPPTRRDLPAVCQDCPQRSACAELPPAMSPALAWRLLGLIGPEGVPTRRGLVFGFFNHGEGLPIAAALEKPDYPIEDLVFDLANIRAGHRFAGSDSPYGGRLGFICQQTYGRQEFPGYLEMGVPPGFGDGAGEVLRELVAGGTNRQRLLTDELRPGDIERAQLEWRSLLRQIAGAPVLDWPRWAELQAAARSFLEKAPSRPSAPPLLGEQMMRHLPRRVA